MSESWLEIPDDPVVGALAASLRPEAMLAFCRQELTEFSPQRRDAWRGVHLLETLYHPARYLRLALALSADDDTPGRRLWPEADIIYIHAPVREPMSRRGRVVRMGRVDVEVYRFPNDRRLRGLRNLTGAVRAKQRWVNWLSSAAGGAEIDPESVQRLLLRYVPEYKWIMRLRGEVASASGEKKRIRVAVRCASPKASVRISARHQAVGRALAACTEVVRVPGTITIEPRIGVVVTEWDRGEPIIDRLIQGEEETILPAFADALKAFHSTRVNGLPTFTPSDLSARVESCVQDLAMVRPDLGQRIAGLATGISDALAKVDVSDTVTLHNDLHTRQVHCKRGKLTFLDLERMAIGDPLMDVAFFTTQLELLAHRADMDVCSPAAKCWAEEFREAYASVTPIRFEKTLWTYAAASAIRFAHGYVRHLRPQWRDLIENCVDYAEQKLSITRREALTR